MDAVLVADAEVNEYRTFIRKGMFGSLLGEKEKYTDLIETLWFHLGESSEKITENYHVFLPSYGKFSGKISKRIRLLNPETSGPAIVQMTVYPIAENQYMILLDELDDSEYQRSRYDKQPERYRDLGRNRSCGNPLQRLAEHDCEYDLADRIRRQTEKTEFPDMGHFTCSIGLAELRPGDTPGSAFERADKALYRAKEAGRNRIVTAD